MFYQTKKAGAVALMLLVTGPASAITECSPSQMEPVKLAPGVISDTGDEVYRGVFSSNQSDFYFFRSLGPNETYGIFKSSKNETGDWATSERVLIGAPHSDLYPTLSLDGERMAFVSYRPAPDDTSEKPNANIWMAVKEQGNWGNPKLLKNLSTFSKYDSKPVFRETGDIAFTSTSADWQTTQEYLATSTSTGFEPPRVDKARKQFRDWGLTKVELYAGSSDLSPDGNTAIIEVSPITEAGKRGPTGLWISKNSENGWTEPTPLNSLITTPEGIENFPTFSADGTTLVFVRDFKSFYTVDLTCN